MVLQKGRQCYNLITETVSLLRVFGDLGRSSSVAFQLSGKPKAYASSGPDTDVWSGARRWTVDCPRNAEARPLLAALLGTRPLLHDRWRVEGGTMA